MTGGITAAAGGITAAIFFGWLVALLFSPREKTDQSKHLHNQKQPPVSRRLFLVRRLLPDFPLLCYNSPCNSERSEGNICFVLIAAKKSPATQPIAHTAAAVHIFQKQPEILPKLIWKNLQPPETRLVPRRVLPFVRHAPSTAGILLQPDMHHIPSAVDPFHSPKRRGIAALLCLLLGCLGVHRFYVGKIGTGIVWLLTFGLYGLGVVVDLWSSLCGSFRDRDGRRPRPLVNFSQNEPQAAGYICSSVSHRNPLSSSSQSRDLRGICRYFFNYKNATNTYDCQQILQ